MGIIILISLIVLCFLNLWLIIYIPTNIKDMEDIKNDIELIEKYLNRIDSKLSGTSTNTGDLLYQIKKIREEGKYYQK